MKERVIYKFNGEPKVGERFKTVDALGFGTVFTWEVIEVLGKVGDKEHKVEAKLISKNRG
ncbi:hypothetical protein [Bacillus mojavensis]